MTTQLRDNRDVASYFVTKHSWRGKYKRVFSVGTAGIVTYNINTLEVTNQWSYDEFVSIVPNPKSQSTDEFVITFLKPTKKSDAMRFSTEHRADLLTEALRFRNKFAEKLPAPKRFNGFKYHWSEKRLPVLLEIGPCSVSQIDVATNRLICSYEYKDMDAIVYVSDCPGGFALISGGHGRMHLYAAEQRDEICKLITELATNCVGVSVRQRKNAIKMDDYWNKQFGVYSADEHITSYAEFTVQKITSRHLDPVRRTLCLSETCLIERDPASYAVVTCKPLCDIFALVRDQHHPQQFSVEFVKGYVRTYLSTDRDALIASMMDGVRASGNRDVHVKMALTNRGLRLGPYTVPVDEEVESQHMKFIQSPPVGKSFGEMVVRFNCNVSYSGLLHAVTADTLFAENKEKLIKGTLVSLLDREDDTEGASVEELEAHFHALRRLVASKAGFMSFTQLPRMRERVGVKVVKALRRNNDGVTHAALDMLCALMQPMHDDYDIRQEQMNKASIMSSKSFLQSLLDMFKNHVLRNSGALVIAAMLDFMTFALCAPYSETTDGTYFDVFLDMVATEGRAIFKLFQHPSVAIVKGAGLVMKAVIEEGEADIAARMQDLALAEGALPRHLHTAMFTASADSRMLTLRQLSRHLVGLWVTGHPTAMALLRRILPIGLLSYLDSKDDPPDNEVDRLHIRDNLKLAQDDENRRQGNIKWKLVEKRLENLLEHWRSRMGFENKQQQSDQQKPIVLRKRRQRIRSEANWKLFYYQFEQSHTRPNLIWNFKTREELRNALEDEIRAFNTDRDLSSSYVISWNHGEFEVQYRSLDDEIKIGDYYLRLLLEEEESEEVSAIKKSAEFFNDLYHRFLLTTKSNMRCMCLQAMAIVYGRCHEEIGGFNDTRFIIGMLERCVDRTERDRLLLFIHKLVFHKKNVKEIMDANGVRLLIDLLTLAHLHVTRATVPMQSNVIEASPDMRRDTEKEWYYGNAEKEKLGPYSFEEMKQLWEEKVLTPKTRCWAQGMDGWKPLVSVPQLKWCLLATGQAVLNETDMATLILNILIRMCEYYPSRDADDAIVRPLPRIKRLLSDATCLPHVVQLLLTFDPVLVEKVATLLYLVVQDNPSLNRLYLSGVFFFILMYTGSNVLPIARFLKYTHLKQAFLSDENKSSDIVKRSVLGHLLPEAMVCYLENYESEKFAETFLGEFDTPEAIWSTEMRRMMIEKIAAHLSDYSPRLTSNTRALYQYCPIPIIVFPQLENELFCSIYYLRHLCDMQRFPNWPIKEPVKLLKEILEAWKAEVDKKPPTLSVDDAYEVLELPKGEGHEEARIRKAYFRLAQKYHPDKNPEGREMFEKVNQAYEFLCSRSKITEGPNPQNIVLILQAQSILFSRYSTVLSEYKYAGYPALVKTIRMETHDDSLFSKSAPLLAAATELCYHTVNCSALNAEELRRENGIEILQEAFGRCVSILSRSTKSDDLAVQVCANVARCYAVASLFGSCREKIQEMPSVVKDLCRILYYKHLARLCSVVTETMGALSIDIMLQHNLHHNGALWSLLLFLFNYDYTLEEGGVQKSGESNQQEVSNQLAKLAVTACARLGGYLTGDLATPDNKEVKRSLCSLLTPYIAHKLKENNPHEVLKLLNSNTENPCLVWNNSTRAELTEFLAEQELQKIRTGECDQSFGADFVFSAHRKELIIGDVFVRVYNEQPTFPLENAKGFTIDLLDFLGSQAQYFHSLMALQLQDGDMPNNGDKTQKVEMALEALRNALRSNPGVEIQCIGHFKLLFSLLRMESCPSVQQRALETLSCVTSNQECVSDIAASEVMAYLLMLLPSLSNCQSLVLSTLYPLTSNTKLLKEMMNKGALVYLLDIYANSLNATVRQQTAELFAKILSDKLVGPKVRLIMCKFLPPVFMDAMRDSAEASVHMFEGTHENPELIWNDEARESVQETLKKMKTQHFQAQKANIDAKWNIPEDFNVVYTNVQGELVVGGVFLRLFIANPAWVLRKPKEFLTELFEKWTQLVSANQPPEELLETVTSAIVALFATQPTMLDYVPQLGYVPRFFRVMATVNSSAPKSAIRIVHQLSNSNVCVQSMAQVECVGPMKTAMQARVDAIGLACEAMMKMFESGLDELVEQALKTETVQYLVKLLESRMEQQENPSAVKAQVVNALKAMQRSLKYGEQVTNILSQFPIWKDYKDQKHDLFLVDRPTVGYLQGPGVAGYLTSSQSTSLPTAPPPMQ